MELLARRPRKGGKSAQAEPPRQAISWKQDGTVQIGTAAKCVASQVEGLIKILSNRISIFHITTILPPGNSDHRP